MQKYEKHSQVVKEWSHQSVLQRYAFKSSVVRPTITTGGATKVLITKKMLKTATIIPRRFNRLISVILTAFAERTRKITDILKIQLLNEILLL